MLNRISFAAVILCGLSMPAFTQVPAATGVTVHPAVNEPVPNADSILAELKTIREKQTGALKSQKAKFIQDIQSRAANPAAAIEFYEAAVKATQFEGESRAQTQFIAWKRKETAHFKTRDFQNGLRLHLNYLALTLQRSSGAEIKTLLPALYSHAQQVGAEHDAGNQDSVLRGSLNDSIFVRWYQIQNWVNGIEGWEMSPGNVDGIYQKTIQPELRRLKDPRITDYWDLKIQREAGQASRSALAFDNGKFDQVRKPALLWNRAEDVLTIGQKNRAVGDMFALIKNYPAHPDSLKWVNRLQAVLTGATEATGNTAAAASAE